MAERKGNNTKKIGNRKKTIMEALALISVLVIAFTGLWGFAEYLRENQDVKEIDIPITVSLKIVGVDWTIQYMDAPTLNNTVYKLLIECSKEYDFPVDYTYWSNYDSVLINSINETENGKDGMWWQYYVNDVYGEIGCDKKEIFDGDMVEWRFEDPMQ